MWGEAASWGRSDVYCRADTFHGECRTITWIEEREVRMRTAKRWTSMFVETQEQSELSPALILTYWRSPSM